MRMTAVLSAVGLIVGCTDGAVPPPGAAHPASPAAAEGVTHVASSNSSAAASSEPAPQGAPAGHQHHGAASAMSAAPAGSTDKTVYTCPMHPEVISDKPGQCPKCGMNLVLKKKD